MIICLLITHFIHLFLYTTFIQRSIHKPMCSNALLTELIKSSFVLAKIRYYSNLKMMTTFVILIIFTCRVCFCFVNNAGPSKNL